MSTKDKLNLPPKRTINTRLSTPVHIPPPINSESTRITPQHGSPPRFGDHRISAAQGLFQRRRNARKIDHPLGWFLKNRHAAAHIPQRTTKTSQKLVLLPENHAVNSFNEEESNYEDLLTPSDAYNLIKLENLPRDKREELGFPRATAYCVCEAFQLPKVKHFLKHYHKVRAKKYDEVLYAVYHLPLVYGRSESCRVSSGPAPDDMPSSASNHNQKHLDSDKPDNENFDSHIISQLYRISEIFVFSYGVVVFWNFSLSQEKDILADLTFGGDNSLMVKPLAEEECEIEDLHFHYAPNTKRPRIYNDMIHIPSADNKMKLAMSHALAQSVKLSRFELRTDVTMNSALFYPKKLALYGHLGLSRVEVVRMSGHLFQLRVDVNLISNILDTPDFLWDSEPLLLPLYTAFREYLEIGPRTNVLNRRCKVIFDMLDIFGKSSADRKMNSITWIIIILISLFVIIFTLEVILRLRWAHR
ncbi:YagE family protein-like protein [Schizosaccharomyces pombe]|uniref:Sad1-interacting factor 3 n=1 Tax=Schizosaccharomyces pombe (strain 972 / ATCC 24843) TaxID=284812 RepID=SIF3_SCHPO|nr:putative Sad1-interacting factor 3 [Schizosaccharomyces pombe]Q09877.2 RecName: Full=Sad1-interacting factor 3 [Schizosaccharomyces pombe 972h-]CAA91510.3 Sad1 interacting factor 3 (predicted) [Schizosaccharomyces pombe]|eukprot:NP_592883.4 putative Sad1-interacting factor 3 [Schizosaccharomyces pombe]